MKKSIAKSPNHQITKYILYCFIILISTLTSSCKIYRFTDASVDPKIKTFVINPTSNIAILQNINASPTLTDQLKNKFLRDTKMSLVRENGDLEFSATITEYSIEPVSITNTETTAQNRLNITIKIDCINKVDAKKSFTQTFRDGENYNANDLFSAKETGLVNNIYERLVQQIFNRTFGNW